MTIDVKENEFIEFKESLSQLDKGLKSLSAMLNRNNHGKVYLGVKDDGEVCGVIIGDNTFQNIRRRVQEMIFPQVVIHIETNKFDNKTIIILSAEGSEIPYSFDGRYFIRNVSSDEQAKPQLLRRMLESTDNDLIRNLKSYNQELTFKDFIEYSRMKGLNIIAGETGYLKSKGLYDREGDYNLMAFILSDQSNVSIKVVKFNGLDKTSFSEKNEYGYHCLLNSIDEVLRYFKSFNITKIEVTSSTTRKEQNLFDFESFREAWINACLHNHWSDMVPPSVFIFDDRIEVVSYGDIPFHLSREDFFNGSSLPVNKSLKDIFVSLGLAEQSGHGVPVIVSKYGREAFSFESCMLKVTIPFAFTPDYVSGRKSLAHSIEKLTENQYNILLFFSKNTDATQNDAAAEFNISVGGVKKILARLSELNLIERVGSKKKGQWVVNANIKSIK